MKENNAIPKIYDSEYSILLDMVDAVKKIPEIKPCELEEVAVDITENGTQNIIPNEGYDGMKKVCINTNVTPVLTDLDQTITTNGLQTYVPDPGVDGFGSVSIDVNVPEPYLVPLTATENKTYNPEPDTDGFSRVTVEVKPTLEDKTLDITANGNFSVAPDAGYDGLNNVSLNVAVPIPEIKLESKTVEATVNGSSTITPSPGFDGISSVSLNVNVPGGAGKAKLAGTGIKFSKSTFTEFPGDLFDFAGVTDGSFMFFYCKKLTTLPLIDCSSITDMRQMFTDCEQLTTIPLIDCSSVTDMGYMFEACSKLTSLPRLNIPNCTQFDCFLSSEWAPDLLDLTELGGFTGLKVDFNSLYKAPNLSRQSLINVFTEAADVTASPKTFTMSQGQIDKLTEDDKLIATNKGWSIVANS